MANRSSAIRLLLTLAAVGAAIGAAGSLQPSRPQGSTGREVSIPPLPRWRTRPVFGYALMSVDIGYRFDAIDPTRVDELVLQVDADVERGMPRGSVIQVRTSSGRLNTYTCKTGSSRGAATCLTLVPRLGRRDLSGVTIVGLFDSAVEDPTL